MPRVASQAVNQNPSPLSQLARPHEIRKANPSIQEDDADSASACDVDDSIEAGNADDGDLGVPDRGSYASKSKLRINETTQDFYQSQVGKPRGRSINHNDV